MLPTFKQEMMWGGALASGKGANVLAAYIEQLNPSLKQYFLKEILGIGGGIGLAVLAAKTYRMKPETADFLGLMGVEMAVDRLVNFAAQQMGMTITSPIGFINAPPRAIAPGSISQYPLVTYPKTPQRLPFQSDLTF